MRLSVDFGKPSSTKKCDDTEWCLAPIPLGDYVKMVDTCEGSVAETDLPFAFDRQHPTERITTTATGPLTSLILVVVLYDLSFSFGVTKVRPYVDTVRPVSIATTAGFIPEGKVLSINGKAIEDWSDVQAKTLLEVEFCRVDVAIRTASGQQTVYTIGVAGTPEAGKATKNSGSIGPWSFKMTARLGLVMRNGPIERAGLKVGDRLLTVDGGPIEQWLNWAGLLHRNPGNRITISYERGDKVYEANVRPDAEEFFNGTLVGKVGMASQRDEA